MAKTKRTRELRRDMIDHRGYDPSEQAGMNRAERRAAERALRKEAAHRRPAREENTNA